MPGKQVDNPNINKTSKTLRKKTEKEDPVSVGKKTAGKKATAKASSILKHAKLTRTKRSSASENTDKLKAVSKKSHDVSKKTKKRLHSAVKEFLNHNKLNKNNVDAVNIYKDILVSSNFSEDDFEELIAITALRKFQPKSYEAYFDPESRLLELFQKLPEPKLKVFNYGKSMFIDNVAAIVKTNEKSSQKIATNIWSILGRPEVKIGDALVQKPMRVKHSESKGVLKSVKHISNERAQKKATGEKKDQSLANTAVITKNDKLVAIRSDNLGSENKYMELLSLYAFQKVRECNSEAEVQALQENGIKLLTTSLLDDSFLKAIGGEAADEKRMLKESRKFIKNLPKGYVEIPITKDGHEYVIKVTPKLINIGVSHYRDGLKPDASFKDALKANESTVDELATEFNERYQDIEVRSNHEHSDLKLKGLTSKSRKQASYNKARKKFYESTNLDEFLKTLKQLRSEMKTFKKNVVVSLNASMQKQIDTDYLNCIKDMTTLFFKEMNDDQTRNALNAIIHASTGGYAVSLDGQHIEKLVQTHDKKDSGALGALSLWNYDALAHECGYDLHKHCKSGQDRTTEAMMLDFVQGYFKDENVSVDIVRLFGTQFKQSKTLLNTVRQVLKGTNPEAGMRRFTEDEKLVINVALKFTEYLDKAAAPFHRTSRDKGEKLKTGSHPIMKLLYLKHKESTIGHSPKSTTTMPNLDVVRDFIAVN